MPPKIQPTVQPLNDEEILRLERQGFREGDFVPGRGVLSPTGTFRNPLAPDDPRVLEMSESLEKARQQALKIQEQLRSGNFSTGNNVVASSEQVVNEERDTITQLTELNNQLVTSSQTPSAAQNMLDFIEKEREALEARRKQEVEALTAQYDSLIGSTQESQKREKGTTQATLARLGGFLGGSASGMGVLNNQAATHRSEISAIEAKKSAAIQAANVAASDKDFQLAKLYIQEVKDYEKDINDRNQKFFSNMLDIIKEDRARQEFTDTVRNRARDDARSALNDIIDNFGGIDIESLDENTLSQLEELSVMSGIPFSTLQRPTLQQLNQLSTEEQRNITNQIALANLQLREKSVAISEFNASISAERFAQSQQLSAIDAQRLGLPRSLVGVPEQLVEEQLRSEQIPEWYFDMLLNKGDITQEQITALESGNEDAQEGAINEIRSQWNKFRTKVVESDPMIDFGSFGAVAPVTG